MEILNAWFGWWGGLGGGRFKVASGENLSVIIACLGKGDLRVYFIRNRVGVDLFHKGWIGTRGEGGEWVGWRVAGTTRWPRPTLRNIY